MQIGDLVMLGNSYQVATQRFGIIVSVDALSTSFSNRTKYWVLVENEQIRLWDFEVMMVIDEV
jgi:hypothetical protein